MYICIFFYLKQYWKGNEQLKLGRWHFAHLKKTDYKRYDLSALGTIKNAYVQLFKTSTDF